MWYKMEGAMSDKIHHAGNHQMLVDHAQSAVKVVAGGVVVGGSTHIAFDIAQATQYASFAAAVATALYFFAQFLLVLFKIVREARRG